MAANVLLGDDCCLFCTPPRVPFPTCETYLFGMGTDRCFRATIVGPSGTEDVAAFMFLGPPNTLGVSWTCAIFPCGVGQTDGGMVISCRAEGGVTYLVGSIGPEFYCTHNPVFATNIQFSPFIARFPAVLVNDTVVGGTCATPYVVQVTLYEVTCPP